MSRLRFRRWAGIDSGLVSSGVMTRPSLWLCRGRCGVDGGFVIGGAVMVGIP